MAKLAGFNYQRVIKKLKKANFEFDRYAKGSHEIWINMETRKRTTVPNHPGNIPEGKNCTVQDYCGFVSGCLSCLEGGKWGLIAYGGIAELRDKKSDRQKRNNFWTSRGYVVFEPNYRGSTGYGDEIMRAIIGHYFEKDVEDIVSGIEALKKRGGHRQGGGHGLERRHQPPSTSINLPTTNLKKF